MAKRIAEPAVPVQDTEPDGPRLTKGERTRARLVAAAEEVFGEGTYDEASIVEITRRAGVSQGTFYLYFPSKLDIFREVVRDLGHQLRMRLSVAVQGAETRAEIERRGFIEFFTFIEEHPEMYRIIRQAEFVDRDSYRAHYERLAAGYVEGLSKGMAAGQVRVMDPEAVAYCLMGLAEIIGMRWILWDGGGGRMPKTVVESILDFIYHGLLPADRS
ncbi:MAG: TetR/AcrR family transcriptional regulator [Actinomycetota bacterium]|nr:TetR/AcrR family transcriptional regulator [Actinomycetota bacterium]